MRIIDKNNCPDCTHRVCFAFGCYCTHKTKELCHRAIKAHNAKIAKGYVQNAKNGRWIKKEVTSMNGRVSVKLSIDGKICNNTEASKKMGITKQELLCRLDRALRAINPIPKPDDKYQRKMKI